MTPTFNLITEPWIPALFHGEAQPREVGLREALARAPDIKELSCQSPLEGAALHRLLLAIVYRVAGPQSEEAWSGTWAAGSFKIAPFDDYFRTWASRFDLFDENRPFYQAPGIPASTATTVAKLGHEFSAGNNPVLFDHSLDDRPRSLRPAEAARLLVALQSFAIGGLITSLPGEPKSAKASHLVKAGVVLLTGDNLFETLMFNILAIDDEPGPLNIVPSRNVPAWEQEPARLDERSPAGLIDLLTWQSRRVLLLPNNDGVVERAALLAGYALPDGFEIDLVEPMAAWVKRDVKDQYPWAPVGFRPERALWRDCGALFQFASDSRKRPHALDWLNSLREAGYLDREEFGLTMFGLSSDRAKVFLWREERLPVPAALLGDLELVARVEQAAAAAASVAQHLRAVTWSMAGEALSPEGTSDRDRTSALVTALAPERSYWPALDQPFRRFVIELAASAETGTTAAREAWAAAIREAASAAFERAASALETSSRGYRAAALRRPAFYGALPALLKDFLPEEKGAVHEPSHN